eukprot:UN04071
MLKCESHNFIQITVAKISSYIMGFTSIKKKTNDTRTQNYYRYIFEKNGEIFNKFRWNVLLVHRDGSRNMTNENEIDVCPDKRNCRFNQLWVDMGTFTIAEQASLAYDTDILVGAHGQALTWGTFLKPKSTLIEILPSGGNMCVRKRVGYYTNYRYLVKAFDIFHTCWGELKIPPTESDWKSASFRVNNERLVRQLDRAIDLKHDFATYQESERICESVSLPHECTEYR